MYYLAFVEQRERATNVGGRERPAAAAALVQEYPNIQLALAWSLESGEAQIGLRLARTVQFLWISRGYPGEGLGWLERLLVLPGAEEPTAARTVCLLAAGYLATTQDNFEAARTFYEAGLPLAKTIDDSWVQWVGPQNFAVYNWTRGDLDTAVRYQREALAIARATDDRVDEAISLSVWATIAAAQGDYAEAQALAEDGRRLAHAVGEQWIESLALVYVGLLALHRGDHGTARGDLEQALKIGRRQGDPFRIAQALEGLGQLATAEGQHADAHAYLAEALRLLDRIGHRATIAATLESFAAFAARFSRPEAALQLAGAAAAVREAFGVPQSRLRRGLLDRHGHGRDG